MKNLLLTFLMLSVLSSTILFAVTFWQTLTPLLLTGFLNYWILLFGIPFLTIIIAWAILLAVEKNRKKGIMQKLLFVSTISFCFFFFFVNFVGILGIMLYIPSKAPNYQIDDNVCDICGKPANILVGRISEGFLVRGQDVFPVDSFLILRGSEIEEYKNKVTRIGEYCEEHAWYSNIELLNRQHGSYVTFGRTGVNYQGGDGAFLWLILILAPSVFLADYFLIRSTYKFKQPKRQPLLLHGIKPNTIFHLTTSLETQ